MYILLYIEYLTNNIHRIYIEYLTNNIHRIYIEYNVFILYYFFCIGKIVYY